MAQPGWVDPRQNDPSNPAHVRGGRGLMDGYCVPKAKYPSVVMGRHLDGSGMPLNMPADVMLKLNRGGVHRLIVGHTPHGTCPTVIRSGGPGMHAPGMHALGLHAPVSAAVGAGETPCPARVELSLRLQPPHLPPVRKPAGAEPSC